MNHNFINFKKPIYNDEDMKQLRENLKIYVSKKYPHITYLNACNWAFYPLKNNIGVDFWDIFLNDENMLDCRNLLFEDAVKKDSVANPKSDAESYFRSIKWLKEYFEERYGGVENYLKTL